MAVEKGCCVHSVTSEHWKYAPQKPVLSLVPNLLCKTFFPASVFPIQKQMSLAEDGNHLSPKLLS